MKHKDITIILLLYNTPKKLLKNFKSYQSFNILILDQSNDFKTKKRLEKILPNIKYYGIRNENKGYASASYSIKGSNHKSSGYKYCWSSKTRSNLKYNNFLIYYLFDL